MEMPFDMQGILPANYRLFNRRLGILETEGGFVELWFGKNVKRKLTGNGRAEQIHMVRLIILWAGSIVRLDHSC